ncbi:MAG: tetratricopeptide repeat protein [Deltaproteobacteria bacterium]|jgi:tetratricopeptide (TPR) repeat protein|nr:tetratricopeptide repeat protein [Deltaproteobacteria bacterium]
MARLSFRLFALALLLAALSAAAGPLFAAEPVPPDRRAKALALVNTAIGMTDSEQAVKLLWQAIEIDPTLRQAYMYLGLYYNSRSDFDKVIEVYSKLIKYRPNEINAYLNIGEAYMSFNPAKLDEALTYYQKAYELDAHSSFAALRIGEILADQGKRDEAVRYLTQASADAANHPTTAAQAKKLLAEMGVM